jgi:AhpD family alkylhydroperoxidase
MDTKTLVQEKYGAAAREVRKSGSVACGDPSLRCCDPITTNLYNEAEKSGLPASAVLASLGCGNPTALIELKPGETVLDLGSGGGIDVLLSARRVGPTGKAFGLDMTDDMLALARENQRQAGVENVEFLKGEIEKIPLPDCSVDVVISNCVINLSADKDRVLREAFRVLKPGGRFAVSDIVVRGEVPAEVRQSMLLWVGCVAGALEEKDYVAKLAQAGFARISVEPTRVHSIEDARHFLIEAGIDVDTIAPLIEDKFISAFIRAEKPMRSLYTDEVAELVAIGAAIAANCEPCFKYHFQQARKLGITREDMMLAVKTAQSVKETPAKAMLQLAHQYLEGDPAGLPIVKSCCG